MSDNDGSDVPRRMPLTDFVTQIKAGSRCVWCGRRWRAGEASRQVGTLEGHTVFACDPSCYRPRRVDPA
jgi:hypothetical protein